MLELPRPSPIPSLKKLYVTRPLLSELTGRLAALSSKVRGVNGKLFFTPSQGDRYGLLSCWITHTRTHTSCTHPEAMQLIPYARKHSPISHTDTWGYDTQDSSYAHKRQRQQQEKLSSRCDEWSKPDFWVGRKKNMAEEWGSGVTVTNESFDLVQEWLSYHLFEDEASLVAHRGRSLSPPERPLWCRKKSWWDVDVIAVWVLLHI